MATDPALDICREARDLLERRLHLYPDPETETLLPMVPMAQLRHVTRILSGLLPLEVERYRKSADSRWLLTQLGTDAQLAAEAGDHREFAGRGRNAPALAIQVDASQLWQYSWADGALTQKPPYPGRGAGCSGAEREASFPDGYLRSGRSPRLLMRAPGASPSTGMSSPRWQYSQSDGSLEPSKRSQSLDRAVDHAPPPPRGRQNTAEQIARTEKNAIPLWRRR